MVFMNWKVFGMLFGVMILFEMVDMIFLLVKSVFVFLYIVVMIRVVVNGMMWVLIVGLILLVILLVLMLIVRYLLIIDVDIKMKMFEILKEMMCRVVIMV